MKLNRTVQRALLVLEHVASSPKGKTLSELSELLGIPKTSLFDILTTLEGLNFLRKHGKRFYVGEKSRDVGNAYIQKQDLRDVAEPILTAAAERFNTSTSLVLLQKNSPDYYFQYHPQDAVMIARQPCQYNHLHATGVGKVLLAFMPKARLSGILKDFAFHNFTKDTIDNMDDLLAELEKVRAQGYAIDNREFHYLLQCVAAPIYHRDKFVAAVSFSDLNLFNDDPSRMVENILETAREITASYDRADMFFEQAVEAE